MWQENIIFTLVFYTYIPLRLIRFISMLYTNTLKIFFATTLLLCCFSLNANVIDQLFSPMKVTVPNTLKNKPSYPDKFVKINPLINEIIAFQGSIVGVGVFGSILVSKDGGEYWEVHNSQTTDDLNDITDFTQSDGKVGLVAVGSNGDIVVSMNGGEDWEVRDSQTTSHLNAITDFTLLNGEPALVAVGYSNRIVVSMNGGKDWEVRDTQIVDYFLDITDFKQSDGNAGLVAIGDNGRIVVSKNNGYDWEVRAQTVNRLNAITEFTLLSGKTGLVAVGDSGRIVVSMNGGEDWEVRDSQTTGDLNAITDFTLLDGKPALVAVGNSGHIVVSMNGGEDWEVRNSQTTGDLNAITDFTLLDGKSGLVAVGYPGSTVASMNGGKHWKFRDSRIIDHLHAITDFMQLNGEVALVAVGDSGLIVVSKNGGDNWEVRDSQTTEDLNAITNFTQLDGKVTLLAVGDDGYIAVSINNGETWDKRNSQTTEDLNAITDFTLLNGKTGIVAIGDYGRIVVSINGGETWEVRDSQTIDHLHAITDFTQLSGKGGLAAIGISGGIFVSINGGETWEVRNSQTIDYLSAITNFTQLDGKTGLVAVGDDGYIAVSMNNGETWDKRDSQTTEDLTNITTFSQFDGKPGLVAVGYGGTIVISTNGGKTWDRRESQTKFPLTNITSFLLSSTKSGLVAVGYEGVIVVSTNDGESWIEHESHTSQILTTITAFPLQGGKTRLVSTGYNGVIIKLASHYIFPSLDSIFITYPIQNKSVVVDVTFLSSDNDCDKTCSGRLFVGNKADKNNSRVFNNILGELLPKNTNSNKHVINDKKAVTWRFIIKPEDYSVVSGEKLYFYPQLETDKYKHSYHSDENYDLNFIYLFNSTPYWFGIAIILLLLSIILLFVFHPISILKIARKVSYSQSIGSALGGRVQAILLLLNNLTVFPVLAKQKRVLDKWVDLNSESFLKTVKKKEVFRDLNYYPLPLKDLTHNEQINVPSKENIKALLGGKNSILEVSGIGGSGKSSFAAQMVTWAQSSSLTKHQVLSIWLDEDVEDLSKWLINKVRKISGDDGLPSFFIKALFKQSRILLIADRVSEQSELTQRQVIDCPSFVHSMLVTTRVTLPFEQLAIIKLHTLPLDSKNLMGYIDNYINNHFNGQQKHISLDRKGDLIKQIARLIMIKDEKKEIPITPLLAKLFVERVIQDPEFEAEKSSVIEIYLDYIDGLNPTDKEVANCLTQNQQLEAVKLVAMAELGDDFKPRWIEREVIAILLAQSLNTESQEPIQRLIDNQILIEQRHGSYMVRFTLDPIAEYVAALAWAEKCGTNELAWKELINNISKFGDSVSGFSLALRVVHDAYAKHRNWPINIWPELNF